MCRELRKVKETKKAFHKVSDELSTYVCTNKHTRGKNSSCFPKQQQAIRK